MINASVFLESIISQESLTKSHVYKHKLRQLAVTRIRELKPECHMTFP